MRYVASILLALSLAGCTTLGMTGPVDLSSTSNGEAVAGKTPQPDRPCPLPAPGAVQPRPYPCQ
jgi:hypothetical protein